MLNARACCKLCKCCGYPQQLCCSRDIPLIIENNSVTEHLSNVSMMMFKSMVLTVVGKLLSKSN